MHQMLYTVQLPNEEGDMHIIIIALAIGVSDMPCDPGPNVSSAFIQSFSKLQKDNLGEQ